MQNEIIYDYSFRKIEERGRAVNAFMKAKKKCIHESFTFLL
jgi:hypothetical protein